MKTTLVNSEKALVNKNTTTSTQVIYWVSTLSLCALMICAVLFMLGDYMGTQELFLALGYPPTLVFPLAFMKIAGIVAIITHKSKLLSEWAYAGFFFVAIFALAAHFESNVGHYAPSLVALFLIVVSYVSSKSLKGY